MTALALLYDELVDYIKRRFHSRDFARDLMHDVCVQNVGETAPRAHHRPFGVSAPDPVQPCHQPHPRG